MKIITNKNFYSNMEEFLDEFVDNPRGCVSEGWGSYVYYYNCIWKRW